MRLFFLFLLIVNLLFGIWIYTQPDRQAAATPPLPEGLEPVLLLHPEDAPDPVASVKIDEAEPAEPASGSQAPPVDQQAGVQCYTLGPFNDEKAIADIRKNLSDRLQDVRVRRREEQERHRYWVYMPSLDSRARALETGKKLAASNIRDYYVVRGGEDNNSISLGHFREKIHADRRMKQLNSLGFDVEMEVIYRQYNLYWLDYQVPSATPPDQSPVAPYLGDGVARLDRDCGQE